MLSDVPLMAYLGWNWIPFPNGLLIACFWFYRLLQLTCNSSNCHARTCDLPASTSARPPLNAGEWPENVLSRFGGPRADLAPNFLLLPPAVFCGEIPCTEHRAAQRTSQSAARLRMYFFVSIRAGRQDEGGFPPVGCQHFADAVVKSN